jgi:hypothetical protein
MRTTILTVAISCLLASPVHATPITWFFEGAITSPGEFSGRPFELRVFLDTDLVGGTSIGLSDVIFGTGFRGEVEIFGFPPIAVNPFLSVQYSAPCIDPTPARCFDPTSPDFAGREITGVAIGSGSNAIQFDSPIGFLRTAPFHLAPLPRSVPFQGVGIDFTLASGVSVHARVGTFCADFVPCAVPEGSSVLYLTVALIALGFLRRRKVGSRPSISHH